MKVLIASSSLVAQSITDWLIHSRHEVVGVLTAPDAPKGRGREINENAFATLARTHQLQIFKVDSADEISKAIQESGAEIVVTAAFGRLIRKRELFEPKYGWLNIHFSLLPRWRGASPVQRAIQQGDTSTGVTVFRLDEGMDTGPIYATVSYQMRGDERGEELLRQLSELSIEPLGKALDLVESGVEPSPQSKNGITLAPKITKEEGRIDWTKSNVEIERSIRAFSTWPNAWSSIEGLRISILSGRCSPQVLKSGTLLIQERILVGCGIGSLELLEVKPEGKRAMPASDWLRGARLSANANFE
jgi:methionyl-tRNA formyltransferase